MFYRKMIQEPNNYRAPSRTNSVASSGRWRWWYSSIADWMIRNPGGKLCDCAKELNKNQNTISMIANSDMFRDYLAQRKAEWRETHDFAILSKVTAVAEKSLDTLLTQLEKKGDQVPVQVMAEIATSTLDRLGYGPKQQPGVQVNVQQNDNRVQVAVGANELLEAREAMRRAESRRAIESRTLVDEESPSEAPTLQPPTQEEPDAPFDPLDLG